MKKILLYFCILIPLVLEAQNTDSRIETIKNQLTVLATDNPGLTENFKSDISVTQITLSNFLIGLSNLHNINITVSPELNQISLTNNFSNVSVTDILIYLCKEHDLTIDFTGNILSIKKYIEPQLKEIREIPILYNPSRDEISLDLKNDKLYDVFKKIIDETGKNLVFSPGLENKPLIFYTQNTPFEAAMDKLAFSNNLYLETSRDGFLLFEALTTQEANTESSTTVQPYQRPIKARGSGFSYEVLDKESKLIKVDFRNVPIVDIVEIIGNELEINIFTATPLNNAGFVTFKAKTISFDELLIKIFEIQHQNIASGNISLTNTQTSSRASSNPSEIFTFKKEDDIYFFGTEKQLSVRQVEIIPLQYRSIELLADPSGSSFSKTNFNTNSFGVNAYDNFNRSTTNNQSNNNKNSFNQNTNQSNQTKVSLQELVPNEVLGNLEIIADYELNSFHVVGTASDIMRFKEFLHLIDKPVPVVLIEVMIIEVSKTSTVETGVSWGIGDQPVQTQGDIFPETNLTLGANTINKIIGGFDDFGSFNLGKVVPNFFATIKAMESNGDLKVRSTPKLATLNGHRATFSNGQTSYYAITQRNIYGTDNPQTSEFTNYYPIDVELGLTIKPTVTSDNHVLLDIFVIQSSFGQRIDDNAPPDINSREFTSIIRMKNQDIAVLGGLEENLTNNSGSGVPLLARIPIIKWLFSKRIREGKKAKLTVLIKPTVIN